MFTASVVLPIEGRPATNYQIPRAQAAGELVEVGESGRQAPQLVGIVVPVIDLIDDTRQELPDRERAVALAEAPFGNIEDALLARSTSSRAVSPSLLNTPEAMSCRARISCRSSERSRTMSA